MKTPRTPPNAWRDAFSSIDSDRLVAILTTDGVSPTVDGRYLHWDKLRHLTPPGDLSHAEWWIGIRFVRSQLQQRVALKDVDGQPFMVSMPGVMQQLLRHVDQDVSGQITISEQVLNPATRRSYLVSSLFEEAITSSQLEGASTSRRVAKDMLRSGRPPRTRSERMILNNYQAMNFVREQRDEPLTPGTVLELHRIATEGTLETPGAAGRLQRPEDERVGIFAEDGQRLHRPPPAETLAERLDAMCQFANQDDDADAYLHPVIRSIILHFWLGYDHPFEDGNGRTARALFYWSMLHHGYWLAEFLTISSILKAAPSRYARSFLYVEWDDNDLTYFVLNQLDVILRAVDGLKGYLQRKMSEVQTTEALIANSSLNHRQAALLGHAMRTPGASYTFRAHARTHGVAYQSARNDLVALADQGLLRRRRAGRTLVFTPAPDIPDLLRQLRDED